MKTTDFIAHTFFSLPKWFDFIYTDFPSMVNGTKKAQKIFGFNTKYNFMSLYQVIIPTNN